MKIFVVKSCRIMRCVLFLILHVKYGLRIRTVDVGLILPALSTEQTCKYRKSSVDVMSAFVLHFMSGFTLLTSDYYLQD